jgi:hypothetical protein
MRAVMNRQEIIEMARSARSEGDWEQYLTLLLMLERENVAKNLSKHIASVLGEKKRDQIFNNLILPSPASPPEAAVAYTNKLMERLKITTGDSEEIMKKALSANAHAIPESAFEREREIFLKADSLEDYLKGSHERAVENLQKHAVSKEVWFEQIITFPVVDLVRSNQEILGGVLKDRKIFLTKIPYRPDQWLNESDPEKRRYLACHCPMARESLNNSKKKIPPLWCHCSAGFAKQKFMALFNQDLEVEVVESVIAGDNVCRFAITVPKEYL